MIITDKAIAVFDDFDWLDFLNYFFTNVTITDNERVALYAEEFYSEIPKIVREEKASVLHNYAVWLR